MEEDWPSVAHENGEVIPCIKGAARPCEMLFSSIRVDLSASLCEAKGMTRAERIYLASHRCHDVDFLLKRWRMVARKAGLQVDDLEGVNHSTILALSNHRESSGRALYLSAGIHGDEPAAVQGLLQWAEENIPFLQNHPVIIFPCLNPWGLVNNIREDEKGRDLNRCFDQPDIRMIAEIHHLIEGCNFGIAACLHEDFDAKGVYVYELARRGEKLGAALLKKVERTIPRHRGRVDGRESRNGVMRRTRGLEQIVEEIGGVPEAVHLFLNHARTALTFETPSEYSLYRRVQCHIRFLDGLADITRRAAE